MASDSPLFPAAVTLAGVATSIYLYRSSKAHTPAPLPPGPKGLPIVGNVADVPPSHPWVRFKELGDQYVHLEVLGQHIIILNDAQYAFDMLDKKSRVYSNRPRLVMAGELIGWEQAPALIQPTKTWSQYRRLMAQFLGSRSKVDVAYGDVMQQSTLEFLKDILDTPNGWKEHGRRFAGSIVLKIAYGYSAAKKDDSLVALVDEAMVGFSEATAPGAFAVDLFPFLQYVPSWVPGTAWKKKAEHYHKTLEQMAEVPFSMVKKQLASGTAASSFVSDLLSAKKEDDWNIKWSAAGIYSGGAETTAAVNETFFLAMTFQQEAQAKAQQELDTVLGRGVLPTLKDRPRLPYVEALIAEVMRKYSIGPLGLPHVASEDDIFEGYFIPKGAMVMTNNWNFYQDERNYKNPELFSPERFMGENKERDPRDFLFGYGRRICPGLHLADTSMWLLFSSILAMFTIKPPVGEDGKEIWPSGKFLTGSISCPEPFECVITPRQGSAEIITRHLDGGDN
ncbi:hypothetical protein VNI00_017376 [Paramarasmius palmivorus]|uniref:Cytochrome P450 n=1 Tax=Paramarasmius palmivorus TaxID=297713 RepID=A0AAW0B680_9AGAR